jgi:hypothetical protein
MGGLGDAVELRVVDPLVGLGVGDELVRAVLVHVDDEERELLVRHDDGAVGLLHVAGGLLGKSILEP